jgi:hypothetical protein
LWQLSADPPVFEIPNFLSADECAAIVAAAESGDKMPPIPYGRKNKIFTGSKYAAAGTDVIAPFADRAGQLFGDVPLSRFEPVTVTRYGVGEFQAKHLDARLPHEVQRNARFLATGGQRIAQLIVYLQPPDAGGSTKFYGRAFDGLAATPAVGKALVFPTATLRGEVRTALAALLLRAHGRAAVRQHAPRHQQRNGLLCDASAAGGCTLPAQRGACRGGVSDDPPRCTPVTARHCGVCARASRVGEQRVCVSANDVRC